jgi:hypothetical protein
MDARTYIDACAPSRHVAEPSAFAFVEKPQLVKKTRLFKKPRYIPDSIPRSRHVAKDMLEFAGIPILMTTLSGDCTVAAPAVTENPKPRKWKSHADA